LNDIKDIRAYIRSILKSKISNFCDMEDLENEVFLALCKMDFRGESKVKTYIHAITKRRISDHFRSKYKRMAKEAEAPVAFMAHEENSCFCDELNEALASLLPRHRMVIILYYLVETDITEICEIMSFGKQRFRSIKKLSLIRMKHFLERKGYNGTRMVC